MNFARSNKLFPIVLAIAFLSAFAAPAFAEASAASQTGSSPAMPNNSRHGEFFTATKAERMRIREERLTRSEFPRQVRLVSRERFVFRQLFKPTLLRGIEREMLWAHNHQSKSTTIN